MQKGGEKKVRRPLVKIKPKHVILFGVVLFIVGGLSKSWFGITANIASLGAVIFVLGLIAHAVKS